MAGSGAACLRHHGRNKTSELCQRKESVCSCIFLFCHSTVCFQSCCSCRKFHHQHVLLRLTARLRPRRELATVPLLLCFLQFAFVPSDFSFPFVRRWARVFLFVSERLYEAFRFVLRARSSQPSLDSSHWLLLIPSFLFLPPLDAVSISV